jgi:formylglycine-generating enzyme required for sulfatase activity
MTNRRPRGSIRAVRTWNGAALIAAAGLGLAGATACEDEVQLIQDDQVCIEKADGSFYCIDVYEAARIDASRTDQGTSDEGAVSLRGRLPWTNLEWADARAACERAGKRLCTVEEWEDACDGQVGEGGNLYPYGDEVMDGVCVTELTQNDDPLPTGSRDGCVSDFGVYDLGGNVWEWVGTTLDDAQVIGGGVNSDLRHRCDRLRIGQPFGVTEEDELLGFRCCSDR